MSFSRLNVLFWNNLIKLRTRQYIQCSIKRTTIRQLFIPTSIGFSLFTWLGFNEKLTPEDEIINTIKHSVLFIQKNEYDRAEKLLHVALRQAQQIQHELGITYIYDVMANLALQREQVDKAKSLFIAVTQRIMAAGATENDLRVIQLSIKLARISHLKKEFQLAQTGYDWCLSKLRPLMKSNPTQDTQILIALAEDWYGRLFLDCKQYENGIKLIESSLEHMKQLNFETEHIVTQLNDLGVICEKHDKFDESIKYFKEAIEQYKTIENKDDLGIMYINLGKTYLKKKMLEEARKSCGYGWRLGHEQNNKEIKKEAGVCLKAVESLS